MEQTESIAARFARSLKGGECIALYYEYDSAVLHPRAQAQLKIVANVLKDNPDKKLKAQRELKANIIASMVTRADGSAITFEEASKFRIALQTKLEEAALKFNGLVPEADAEAKNG